MAALLRHSFDLVAICPVCGNLVEQRYDHEAIMPDEHGSQLGAARQYTCFGCHGSYHRDFEPREGLTDADIFRVLDRREWARHRAECMRGVGTRTIAGVAPAAALSAPGPMSRGVLSEEGRRYSFVREVV
jgi:hypothetical protein